MIKTGIVISIVNRKAGIMTSSGEFVYTKINKVFPKVGEIHTGELCVKNLFIYKYAMTAASLMFIFISSAYAHSYYTPVTTIVLSNPSVSLQANRWNKIISSKALDSNGSLILNNIKLKNKSIDSGLELIVKEAKSENFINEKYINDKKFINMHIKSNKDTSIDISNFKDIIDSNNLNLKINASSDNNKNIDITVDNKKINTFNLNPNSDKKEATNKKPIIVNSPLEKPSVDINTIMIEEKSSIIEEEIKKNNQTNISKDNEIIKDDKSENKNPNNDNDNDNSSIIKKSDASDEIEKK